MLDNCNCTPHDQIYYGGHNPKCPARFNPVPPTVNKNFIVQPDKARVEIAREYSCPRCGCLIGDHKTEILGTCSLSPEEATKILLQECQEIVSALSATPPAKEVDWEELMLTDEYQDVIYYAQLGSITKGEEAVLAFLAKVRQAMEGK